MDHITYLSIGSAYNPENGLQQFPPFLENLMKNDNLSCKIIIIDPILEEEPMVLKYLTNDLNYKLHNTRKQNKFKLQYNNNIIKIRTFRQPFDFTLSNNSINYITDIVRKLLNQKLYYPNETCLFFVHDFSGYGLDNVNELLMKQYKNNDSFKQNIQIGLGTINDVVCSPNLNSETFQPIIYKGLPMGILNCNLLCSFEIAIVFCADLDYVIKDVMAQIIQNRLNLYINSVLSDYRQIMLCLRNNNLYNIKYSSILCQGPILIEVGQTKKIIKNNIVSNLLAGIYNIVDFLSYYDNISTNIFNKLKYFCKSDLSDVYTTLDVFKICVSDMFNHIKTINMPHLVSFYIKCAKGNNDALSGLIKK